MGKSIAEGTSTFVLAINQYDNFIKERRAERERRKNLRLNNIKKSDNKLFIEQ